MRRRGLEHGPIQSPERELLEDDTSIESIVVTDIKRHRTQDM